MYYRRNSNIEELCMKIVILDGYYANPGDVSWEEIFNLGDVTIYEHTPPELVLSRIGDAEIVLLNKILFTNEIFNACPNLKYIGIMATGYNIIDLKAADDHNITVCNVPSYSTSSVVQHTFALLLELCNRTCEHSRSVAAGDWSKNQGFCYWKTAPVELWGKTMGLVGFGQIGRGVARVASAFGMKVLACAAHKRDSDIDGVKMAELSEVLSQSDIISLHCPLTQANTKMINSESLAKMKSGIILINTARGGLVDESAVAEALNSGRLAGYAADVLTEEPPINGSALIGAPNCIITPHYAWASVECRRRLISAVAENIRCFIEGHPQNVITTNK
jgi:glycerate dehydrogenase